MKPGLLALFPLLFSLPLKAEVVTCPDLAAAVQVGACPSEEELEFTFTGYCSDNARMYDWPEEQVCSNYELYRTLKNVALWEVEGGKFQGYLPCGISPEAVRGAKPQTVEVSRKGKLTRVACKYATGVTFVHRTKLQCKTEKDGNCAKDATACQVRCE